MSYRMMLHITMKIVFNIGPKHQPKMKMNNVLQMKMNNVLEIILKNDLRFKI